MEECKELLNFIKDFLKDNEGNRYNKYLTNLLYANFEGRIEKIEQKYKALENMKFGKNDKIIENKIEGD